MRAHYWRCTECNHVCVEAQMLRALHPFDQRCEVNGCPNCKAIEHFEMLCDVTGCKEIATSGWPSADGYRHTCHHHHHHRDPVPSAPPAGERGGE